MILRIEDWELSLNQTKTKAYSDAEAKCHCTCGYCRNFYEAVESAYPTLSAFLSNFGLNIFAPDELIPYEPTLCDVSYGVCGSIQHYGEKRIQVDGLEITIEPWDQVSINSECPKPCFVVTVHQLSLPWVLEESLEDVVSPAQEQSFLRRIWSRLVKKQNAN